MEMLDGDGAPVATERARFRGPKVVHWGGELESFPRDLTPLLGAALALRGLEFEQGARRSFSAWAVSSIYWQVDTRVEKEETVNVPAGALAAWRVRLRPSFEQVDKALDSLMDSLMPPLVAHFEKDPPHRFLRLRFPTGPFRGNPPGVIEATEPSRARPDPRRRRRAARGGFRPARHVLAAESSVRIVVGDDVVELLAVVPGPRLPAAGLGLDSADTATLSRQRGHRGVQGAGSEGRRQLAVAERAAGPGPAPRP